MSAAVPANLGPLMSFIDKEFAFTDKKYPGRRLCTTDLERLSHDVAHSHQHMSKTTGKVGAVCEAYGHTGEIDQDALRDAVASDIATALKLACVLGMTSQDVVDAVVHTVSANPANQGRKARDKQPFPDRLLVPLAD